MLKNMFLSLISLIMSSITSVFVIPIIDLVAVCMKALSSEVCGAVLPTATSIIRGTTVEDHAQALAKMGRVASAGSMY